MNNPTDDFTKAVESALLAAREGELHKRYKTGRPEMSVAEALASIQASTVLLLEGLKAELPTKFSPANKDGFSGGWHVDTYKLAAEDFRQDIDQLIKDLSK